MAWCQLIQKQSPKGPVPGGADKGDQVAWEAVLHMLRLPGKVRVWANWRMNFGLDYDGSKDDDCGSDTKEDAIKHEWDGELQIWT